jgi:multidrug efflux pump subunit AcrB
MDVKQLELNPLSHPVAVRLSARSDAGEERSEKEIQRLRLAADALVELIRSAPSAERVRSNWGEERFEARAQVDGDLASLAGVSSLDVSLSLEAGYDGVTVSVVREEDHRLPVLVRLRDEDRPKLAQLGNLYVFPGDGSAAIPLEAIADVDVELTTGRIERLDHFRTVTVFGFPRDGKLAADVMEEIEGPLAELEKRMPPGFELELSGEPARQKSGFANLARILAVSATGIFLALVFQFRNFVKPLVVLMGVPFGFAGGLATLHLMGESLSFMAMLGLVSLVGVIVSHIIVLFTFIEERRREGESLELALLDAGIVRLRPVLITVSATVLALVPLAFHGGPLWQPLCYAQIGGLTAATVISLVIIPVLYAICVKDLKIVRWESAEQQASG